MQHERGQTFPRKQVRPDPPGLMQHERGQSFTRKQVCPDPPGVMQHERGQTFTRKQVRPDPPGVMQHERGQTFTRKQVRPDPPGATQHERGQTFTRQGRALAAHLVRWSRRRGRAHPARRLWRQGRALAALARSGAGFGLIKGFGVVFGFLGFVKVCSVLCVGFVLLEQFSSGFVPLRLRSRKARTAVCLGRLVLSRE